MNATYKMFILNLMTNAQLPVCKQFDAKMSVHALIKNTDISLSLEFDGTCQINQANMVF